MGAYLRFVDDFVLLDDSKRVLVRAIEAVQSWLATLRLTVHPNKSVLRRTDEGVPFLGYVIWPDRIRVRGETVRRFRRRVRRYRVSDPERACRSLGAWRGHTGLAGRGRGVSGRLG